MERRSLTISARSLSVIKRLLTFVVVLLAPEIAFAQCTQSGTANGVPTSTIGNCQSAVSLQLSDSVLGWQTLQTPHTRQITIGQIAAATLASGGTMSGTFAGNPIFSGAPALGAGVVTAAGGSAARTLANRASDVFNIMDYGAVCDGATNDNTAINAAVAAAYNSAAYQNNNAVTIIGTARRGCVMNSINATMFTNGTGANTRPRVVFRDMTLLCTGAGNVCFDALGADFIKMENVSIRGDSVAAPEICIQVGMINATSAAWHSFDHVNCNNEFTLTALYNFGSEANTYFDDVFHNAHTSSGPIKALGAITAGSSYTNGTYTNVALTGGVGTGALATIVVSGTVITSVTVTYQGRDYAPADVLSADPTTIGGTGSGFSIPVSTVTPYAVILDGQNYWRATSAFVTNTLAVNAWQSLTLLSFIDTNIRQNASGGGLWAAWTAGLHLIHSYILQTSGTSCITLFNNGVVKSGIPDQNVGLNLDYNCEGGPTYNLFLTGSNATPSVQNMKLGQASMASVAQIGLDTNITAVTMQNAKIDFMYELPAGLPMFSSAKLFTVTGDAAVIAPGNWNAPASFQGRLFVGGNATPPGIGPVDILSGAAQAVSCARQMSHTYTGPLCQVTRTSDSTTLDIYPNANGDMDRNAFTGFCKGTTCGVSIMYDQSGNTNNFTQSTAASQPALSLTATLGNRPALAFGDAGAVAMTAAAAASINDLWATGAYVSTVVSQPSISSQANRILYKSNGGAPGTGWDLRVNSGGRSLTLSEGAATTNGAWTTTGTLASQLVIDAQYSAASLSNVPTIGGNGTSIVTGSTQPVGSIGTDASLALLLGNSAATGGTRGYPGSIAEVVMWKTTPTAAQLEAIRRNQAAYYGVPAVN